MAKREKRSVGSTPTTPSEEAAAKRAARRENRPTTGVPSTRASEPPRQTVAQANRKKREILSQEQIAYQLAHPTKTVSYEELQRDYNHVVRDIRNMFILAAILMVSMVILAQVL
ncbi:MAG: hypothetical protein SH821_01160 [Phototrophicales bacterium]|nr:hypothetical protein [Phototrophicales bacterium]